jgi:hypothetical protein
MGFLCLLLPSGDPNKYGKGNGVFIFEHFFFSLSDVGENGDPAFIRRGIGNRKHTIYVVSINSSIKNHFFYSHD